MVKRILLIVGAVVALFIVAVLAVVLPAFLGRRSLAANTEVNGIRIVKDGIVSLGIIPMGPGAVALIDAGNDKTGKAVLAELSRMGLGPDAVQAVLLTHGHPDHMGAIAVLPKAQVMALERDVALAEGSAGSHGPLLRLMPVGPTGVKISRALHDGESVPLGNATVRVYAVPGHTGGSAAYLVSGVLFLGDAADVSNDGKIKGAPWALSDSQDQDRESLAALNQRLTKDGADVKAIECAHSGVLMEGLAPLTAYAQQSR